MLVGTWHLGDWEHHPELPGIDVNIGGSIAPDKTSGRAMPAASGAPLMIRWPGVSQFKGGELKAQRLQVTL